MEDFGEFRLVWTNGHARRRDDETAEEAQALLLALDEALGAASFAESHPAERPRRDLLVYLRQTDPDGMGQAALEAGAEDVVANDDGSFDVFTSFEEFGAVRDALDAAGFAAESADVAMIPSTEAELDLDTAQKVVKLIDMLEDLDDVQNVYSNASISDDIMEQLG